MEGMAKIPRDREETEMNVKIVITGIVWAAAFKVSASHTVGVAMDHGNRLDDALMYPILIDAMIVGCALWVASPKGVNKSTKLWSAFGRIFGFAATVVVNFAHADLSDWKSVVVSLLPAVGVIVMTEVFIHGMKGTVATRAAKATKVSAPAKLRAVK
jgi:hypothetical protein